MTLHAQCRTCGAALVFEGAVRSTICPFCASPSVVERPPTAGVAPPRFVLGFGVTREAAVTAVRRWARRGLFRHTGLDRASIDEIRGAYVPAWLYSAVGRARYQARIGENYTVRRTRTVMRNGRSTTQSYTSTETEWRPLAGEFLTYVADVLVTASRGLENAELTALEPYDLRPLARYAPGLVAGFVAEDVTLDPQTSRAHAHAETSAGIGAALERFMPGDRHADVRFEARVEQEAADVVLLPVWVLALRHDPEKPPLRVLVNGQSGKIVGKKPIAWWKVALAVTAALLLIAIPFIVAMVSR